MRDLRVRLFRRLLMQETAFFDACTSGSQRPPLLGHWGDVGRSDVGVPVHDQALVRIGGIAAYGALQWRLAWSRSGGAHLQRRGQEVRRLAPRQRARRCRPAWRRPTARPSKR